MSYQALHLAQAPSIEEVQALRGNVVLEFGTAWCSHCQAAQALIRATLAARSDVAHIKIEDGPGRALGRNYRVKLWPTLVFLRDGQELGRCVRPQEAASLDAEMAKLPQA